MSAISLVLFGLAIGSAVYWLWALGCTIRFASQRRSSAGFFPPVTVLKPLCGGDCCLYENLRSFCRQRYPIYQVLFGVSDRYDPAIPVVDRLMREFPALDLTLVVSDRLIGANLKVCNLSNLYRQAKHDVLVLADSDIRVGPEYLATVVGPLRDRGVGVVTCLYKGVPTGGLWSALGAMFINEWFFPSALAAAALGTLRHAFGATIACRRDTLEAIGGFERLADFLADDYVLGWLAACRGFRVVLSSYVVEHVILERQFRALFYRELRWARTYRTARPRGYFFSVLTHGLPLSFLLLLASPGSPLAVTVFAGHLALRLVGRLIVRKVLRVGGSFYAAWLVPVRDALSFTLWALSFLGRTVRWKDFCFTVCRDGRVCLVPAAGSGAPGAGWSREPRP